MIRSIEEKDIPVILDWYNWYIRNSTATFETEELTLIEFKQRVHKIIEKYPW
ncbi:MAG: GNAT family N-acetyltransferase, partial [Solobacterium sp.]|nr:GNAT family N-acetyltransferase [Solobacterium sp.]